MRIKLIATPQSGSEVDDGGRCRYALVMSFVDHIVPRWAASWGAIVRRKAIVRSQCYLCGMQHRVDPTVMALRSGSIICARAMLY